MSSYTIEYFVAPGLSLTVDAVSEGDLRAALKHLENPNGVIHVSGKSSRQQALPVRNILMVEYKEVA